MATSEHVLVPMFSPLGTDRLRLAVAAYLTRFKGQSRVHFDSDGRAFLSWCHERDLDPLSAQHPLHRADVR